LVLIREKNALQRKFEILQQEATRLDTDRDLLLLEHRGKLKKVQEAHQENLIGELSYLRSQLENDYHRMQKDTLTNLEAIEKQNLLSKDLNKKKSEIKALFLKHEESLDLIQKLNLNKNDIISRHQQELSTIKKENDNALKALEEELNNRKHQEIERLHKDFKNKIEESQVTFEKQKLLLSSNASEQQKNLMALVDTIEGEKRDLKRQVETLNTQVDQLKTVIDDLETKNETTHRDAEAEITLLKTNHEVEIGRIKAKFETVRHYTNFIL